MVREMVVLPIEMARHLWEVKDRKVEDSNHNRILNRKFKDDFNREEEDIYLTPPSSPKREEFTPPSSSVNLPTPTTSALSAAPIIASSAIQLQTTPLRHKKADPYKNLINKMRQGGR